MQFYITLVEIILIVTIIGMIVLEAFLSFNKIKGDTISGIINQWAYGKSFFITFSWGIVTGHFFLGTKQILLGEPIVSILVVALLAVIAALIGCQMKAKKTKWIFQAIMLIAGATVGHFFWSMNDIY